MLKQGKFKYFKVSQCFCFLSLLSTNDVVMVEGGVAKVGTNFGGCILSGTSEIKRIKIRIGKILNSSQTFFID